MASGTIPILVCGDSIAWGQGLSPAQKLAGLISAAILANPSAPGAVGGATPVPTPIILAHSAASLGTPPGTAATVPVNPGGSMTFAEGEVPGAVGSTVFDQVVASAATVLPPMGLTPSQVAFIIVDGGINDLGPAAPVPLPGGIVGPFELLNPFLNSASLTTDVDIICGGPLTAAESALSGGSSTGRMSALLGLVTSTYPGAQIFVLGYYDVVGAQSNLTGLEFAIAALVGAIAGVFAWVATLIAGVVTKAAIVANSALFTSRANAQLAAAVAAIAATPAGVFPGTSQTRILFVTPDITPGHEIFVSSSNGADAVSSTPAHVWGFNPSLSSIESTVSTDVSVGAFFGGLFGGPAGAVAGAVTGAMVALSTILPKLAPVDEVATTRAGACSASGGGTVCTLASVDHPNREGEASYAASILPVVNNVIDEMAVLNATGACMIATASYGSDRAPQVNRLRELRAEFLSSSRLGQDFFGRLNHEYYAFSPVVARRMAGSAHFKETVRLVLVDPFLSFLELLSASLEQDPKSVDAKHLERTLDKTLHDIEAAGISASEAAQVSQRLAHTDLRSNASTSRVPVKAVEDEARPVDVLTFVVDSARSALPSGAPYVQLSLVEPLRIYWGLLEQKLARRSAAQLLETFESSLAEWFGGVVVPPLFASLSESEARKELAQLSSTLFTRTDLRRRFGAELAKRRPDVQYDLVALLSDLDYLGGLGAKKEGR